MLLDATSAIYSLLSYFSLLLTDLHFWVGGQKCLERVSNGGETICPKGFVSYFKKGLNLIQWHKSEREKLYGVGGVHYILLFLKNLIIAYSVSSSFMVIFLNIRRGSYSSTRWGGKSRSHFLRKMSHFAFPNQ